MRRCIMGCKLGNGNKLHIFPQNAKRRAEWCRILGVFPRSKAVYLCSAHIPDYYIQGNRISIFTIPNPPEYRKFANKVPFSCDDYITVKSENDISDLNEDVELPSEDKEENKKSQKIQENKIENFEIRKGNNNDMIIKGRFIQTDNYLMVSYTPPKKWTLQRQVKLLDEHCSRQLKQIKLLNRINYLLRTENIKYEKLLPKLRYLQRRNRFLYAQLKICKLKEKAARKRKMARKLKNQEVAKTLKDNSLQELRKLDGATMSEHNSPES